MVASQRIQLMTVFETSQCTVGCTHVIVFELQEDFSNYEANDPWVQNVICNLDSLLVSFKVRCFQNLHIRYN